MKTKNIIIAIAALAVGVAVGWFAGGLGVKGNGELVTGNREWEGRESVAAKTKRKAPIRSSADAEVQERILRGRVATLKKQLAVAKRMDEARKMSPSATESDTAERVWICEEEAKNLMKRTGKTKPGDWTVGERPRKSDLGNRSP